MVKIVDIQVKGTQGRNRLQKGLRVIGEDVRTWGKNNNMVDRKE